MENLSFSLLALQFFKYQASLVQAGFSFKLEEGTNLYEDIISISYTEFLKVYYFTIKADEWKQYRQFTMWNSQTGKYHFRINPVTMQPMRINSTEPISFTTMTPAEPPEDLQRFGQAILQIILDVSNRLRNDSLIYNSTKKLN